MLSAISAWVHGRIWAYQRRLDMEMLWPACCALAEDIHMARSIFTAHAVQDPAWQALDPEVFFATIDNLQLVAI